MPCASGSVFDLHRLGKKKWQPIADAVGAYGAGILADADRRNHECYFGLYLNQQRQRTRYAISVTQGVGLALSPEWPEDVFAAIANNDEEADYLFQMHRANAVLNAANTPRPQ